MKPKGQDRGGVIENIAPAVLPRYTATSMPKWKATGLVLKRLSVWVCTKVMEQAVL